MLWPGIPELPEDANSVFAELQFFPPASPHSLKQTSSSQLFGVSCGNRKCLNDDTRKGEKWFEDCKLSQSVFCDQIGKGKYQASKKNLRQQTLLLNQPLPGSRSSQKPIPENIYDQQEDDYVKSQRYMYLTPYKLSGRVSPVEGRVLENKPMFHATAFEDQDVGHEDTILENESSLTLMLDDDLDLNLSQSSHPAERQCFQFSQVRKPKSYETEKRVYTQPISNHHNFENLPLKNKVTSVASSQFMRHPPDLEKNKKCLPDNTSTDAPRTSTSLYVPLAEKGRSKLRSVEEIPSRFRDVFSFPYFNMVQSMVFDDVVYTDKPLIVSAPTGAGKTAIFELAIIRLLANFAEGNANWKIVYVAPIKALCSERFLDWTKKFQSHGLVCMELTGDTEMENFADLQRTNFILTTPEKWDSMSRKWKDNKSFFQMIALFLIDEIHVLNDSTRGATVEAVVSRMKILQLVNRVTDKTGMRILAVSATIPNIEDLGVWLGNSGSPAQSFKLGEKYRPVKLQKIVVGYPFKEGTSDFKFDMNLAYRLKGLIDTYSNRKPTLVFCSSRKSVEQTAEVLKKENYGRSFLQTQNRETVQKVALTMKENKVADMVRLGIGVHHAGVGVGERKQVEELFRKGLLPVLISTSTLAMGVNLPAHLVVIKSTVFYSMGSPTEYSDSQVLQMIGRAGRPQFDTSATAVIMTKSSTKYKYENLVNGTQNIESSLHKHLIEHLNAEVVLHTITDMSLAVEWIRHTFLYVRIMKNPTHYGYPQGLDKKQVEKRLEELCLTCLNELEALKLVSMDQETFSISPTETGKLMARYCIAFQTMKRFHNVQGQEESIDMLDLIVGCSEFDEFIQLRNNEKSTLNALNKNKQKQTIRYPIAGKIKTKQMKTNCLMQAQLSCLPVQDFSLSQDILKIFRVGQRVAKCLMEFLWQRKDYKALVTATELYKSMKSKLWVDSKFVAKQLDGIGPTMSLALVNAGLTSFQKLEETNPRELELIVNRHPPFGNQIRDSLALLPKYEMSIEQLKSYKAEKSELVLTIKLANRDVIQNKNGVTSHQSWLLIGNQDNNIVFKWRIMDSQLLRDECWRRKVDVARAAKGPDLHIHLISLEYVGLDICTTYTPVYTWSARFSKREAPEVKKSAAVVDQKKTKKTNLTQGTLQFPGQCQHKCINKSICGHKCCKEGVSRNAERVLQSSAPSVIRQAKGIDHHIRMLKDKTTTWDLPNGSIKRQKMDAATPDLGFQRFAYQRPPSMSLATQPAQVNDQRKFHFKHRNPTSGGFQGFERKLANIPNLKYGVGGRRLDSCSNVLPSVAEICESDFEDAMEDKHVSEFQQDFEDDIDFSLAEDLEDFPEDDFIVQTHQQTFDLQAQEDTSDVSNDFEPKSLQKHEFLQLKGDVVNTELSGSEDSLEDVTVEQVLLCGQAGHIVPNTASQEDWAELNMYLSKREALCDEVIDLSGSDGERDRLLMSYEYDAGGRTVNLQEDEPVRSTEADALMLREILPGSFRRQGFTSEQPHQPHRSSDSLHVPLNKPPQKHRFGQVLAWVQDSDSSPNSPKSIPRCKTPVFKRKSPFQKCISDTVPASRPQEPSRREENVANREKPVLNNGFLPLRLSNPSFFHLFSNNDEDEAENPNIFAGVF